MTSWTPEFVSEFAESKMEMPLLPNADQCALSYTTLFRIFT